MKSPLKHTLFVFKLKGFQVPNRESFLENDARALQVTVSSVRKKSLNLGFLCMLILKQILD